MITRLSEQSLRLTALLVVCLLVGPSAISQDQTKSGTLPMKVMDSLSARFPGAEVHKWSREKEGKVILYDIEFKQGSRNLEADIREDGSFENWEQEIPTRDLPVVVAKAVSSRHPGAAVRIVMAITAVKDGKDVLEGYEITLQTAGRKAVEITVAPDGRILEDSGMK
jgi:hypothetical protein